MGSISIFTLFINFFNFIIIETLVFLDFLKYFIPNSSIFIFSIYYLYTISFLKNLDLKKNKFFKIFFFILIYNKFTYNLFLVLL